MTAVYLRFAAPLQSWATSRVTGNIVRTERRPTRSAIVGLIAGALGAPRDAWPAWLADLKIEVRTEYTGEYIDDFQTINPRDEDIEYQRRAYLLMTGKRWVKSAHFTPDAEVGTSIVRRTYLANAEFVVSICSEDHFDELVAAIKNPKFSTYLGKKAFAPVFPFFLGIGAPSNIDSLPTAERAKRQQWQSAPSELEVLAEDTVETPSQFKDLRIDTFHPFTPRARQHGDESMESQAIRSQKVTQEWRSVTVPQLVRREWRKAVGELLTR